LLSLTVPQVEFLAGKIPISDGLRSAIYKSRVWDDIVKIRCSLEELAELSGTVERAGSIDSTTDSELSRNLQAAIAEVEQRYFMPIKLARTP